MFHPMVILPPSHVTAPSEESGMAFAKRDDRMNGRLVPWSRRRCSPAHSSTTALHIRGHSLYKTQRGPAVFRSTITSTGCSKGRHLPDGGPYTRSSWRGDPGDDPAPTGWSVLCRRWPTAATNAGGRSSLVPSTWRWRRTVGSYLGKDAAEKGWTSWSPPGGGRLPTRSPPWRGDANYMNSQLSRWRRWSTIRRGDFALDSAGLSAKGAARTCSW